MTEQIVELRRLLMSHQVADPYIVVQDLLKILESHERAIESMVGTLASHNRTIANQQAEISRLKGIHGA